MTALREETRRDGRKSPRTYAYYVKALREYLELYNELTAACFSPAAAKRNGRPDLVERYYTPRPSDGTAWPSANAIKKHFGGFNAARKAVGLPPSKTMPPKGRRKPGSAVPILEVRDRRVVVDGGATVALRRQLEKAERRALQAERALEKAKSQVPALDNIDTLRRRLADERSRRKDIQRALRNAERRESRARIRVEALQGTTQDDTIREVERLTDRLTDTQLKIRELEAAAREEKVEIPRVVTKTVTRKVTVSEEKLQKRAERAETQIEELRTELSRSEALRAELVERLADIRKEAMADASAQARVQSAERRLVEAEKRMVELAELATGQRRLLSAEEVRELRREGPSGEAMLTAALRALTRARREGGKVAQAAALREVASAALRWSDKL